MPRTKGTLTTLKFVAIMKNGSVFSKFVLFCSLLTYLYIYIYIYRPQTGQHALIVNSQKGKRTMDLRPIRLCESIARLHTYKQEIYSALNCEVYSSFEGVSSYHRIVTAQIRLGLMQKLKKPSQNQMLRLVFTYQ